MGFNCGIVGLPNVGKSTIFNALTSAGAEAANYPFCTIEPNTGIVPLRDTRLDTLSQIMNSEKVIPTSVEFVDIAGLVKGASKGEGLGNQFLGHIRSVDAIVHVVRCFEDENVTHVDGDVSPQRDVEVIETELMLSDLESVEKQIDRVSRKARTGDKDAKSLLESLEFAKKHLDDGKVLSTVEDEEGLLDCLDMITLKPMFFVANVDESQAAKDVSKKEDLSGPLAELVSFANERGNDVVIISGKVESEISDLDEEERESFLEALELTSSGLDRLAEQAHNILKLITFFTCGPKETRAWTIQKGTAAVDAAGVIHTDFSKGFIRAEVIGYDDYVTSKGELGAKEKGLLRLEGKAYIVKDGDVMHFRFNV